MKPKKPSITEKAQEVVELKAAFRKFYSLLNKYGQGAVIPAHNPDIPDILLASVADKANTILLLLDHPYFFYVADMDESNTQMKERP